MSKMGLEKEEELDIKLLTFAESQRKQGNARKTSTSVSSTALKLDWVDHDELWKVLREMGIPDLLPVA